MLPPIVGGFTWILKTSGPYMPLYLWAFVFVLSMLLMTWVPLPPPPLSQHASACLRDLWACVFVLPLLLMT
jgi:hypothetical protein